MKKWLAISLVALIGLGTGATVAWAKDQYVLRLGIEHGPDHPYTQAMKRFATLVGEKTGGSVEIRLYPSAQLGSATEMIEGMKIGSIDMVLTAPAYFRSQLPEMDVLLIPFLIEDADHYEKVMAGQVGQFITTKLEERGYVILAYYYGGMREFTNNRNPINSVEDMKGLKMRVPGLPVLIKCYEKFGVLPTPVPFADLYTALQTGMVDAQENPVAQIDDSKFYEVQNYLSLSNHQVTPVGLIIGKRSFRKLPAQIQKVLADTAREIAPWSRTNIEASENSTLNKLKAKGMQVNAVKDKAGFRKAVEPLYVEIPQMIGKDVDWIVEAVKNAR
jgi:tripartite ATP-independent transporter DctP family solute receptor